MDRPRHNDQLAVKKIGKKIKKTLLHLPNLANGYTSKNRLRRSIVPHIPPPPPAMAQPAHNLARPPMMGHEDQFGSSTAAACPVPVCMPSLQNSSGDSRPNGDHMQPSHQYQLHKSLPSARFSGGGILPTPQSSFGPNRNQMQPSHDYQPYQQSESHNHHSPLFSGSATSVPILPSPRFKGRGILPTPPEVQNPPSRTPTSFTSSSMSQGGILGPGKFPHASTALVFPPSPFGENTY